MLRGPTRSFLVWQSYFTKLLSLKQDPLAYFYIAKSIFFSRKKSNELWIKLMWHRICQCKCRHLCLEYTTKRWNGYKTNKLKVNLNLSHVSNRQLSHFCLWSMWYTCLRARLWQMSVAFSLQCFWFRVTVYFLNMSRYWHNLVDLTFWGWLQSESFCHSDNGTSI